MDFDRVLVEIVPAGAGRAVLWSGMPVIKNDSLKIAPDNIDFSVSARNVAVKTAY